MPRRRRETTEAKGGSPAWMTTYGDMVTLLLTFFVFLFAFSTIEVKKFEAAIASLQGAFGLPLMVEDEPGPEAEPLEGHRPEWDDILTEDLQQLLQIERMLRSFIREENLESEIRLEREGRGLVVRFADNVLFDLGKADLKPGARRILDRLAMVIAGIPNDIRVEGHTDDLPIHTAAFPSNWELSTRRATEVVRYFAEAHRFSPVRLSAAGYGEYRPLAPNDTYENRRLNRRVDVVIIKLSLSTYETAQRGYPW